MLNNFSFNDAYRVIKNVIDERISALTKSGAGIEVTWGTIAEVTSPYTCSVYLYGEALPSEGFRIENGIQPNLLDPVRVSIDKRGNRWIDAVMSDASVAYPKLEIDVRNGEIRYGDGTTPATPPVTASSVPTGAIVPYGGATAPTGFLLCDGTSYLRADYQDLFDVIGTAYGSVDGTRFNVPNLVDKFPMGGTSLGTTGGALNHTHTSAAHSHSHAHTLSAHTHTMAHTHTSDPHSHTLSDAGWAQVMMTVSGGNGSIHLRRITAGVGWTSNFTTGSIASSTATGGAETVAVGLDGTTDSTTPDATGGASTSTTSAPSSDTTDTDATSTTPGVTGTNNPPYVVVQYLIKI